MNSPEKCFISLVHCLILVAAIEWFCGPSALAADCSGNRAESVRRLAQSLDSRAATAGESFLKECPKDRGNVLPWLSYFYRARGQYVEAASLVRYSPRGGDALSEHDRLLALAAKGEPDELAKHVRRHEPGYSDDAETLLVLARGMAQQKRFGEAHVYYAEYLKQKPEDRDIEIEEAYTSLWEGNGRAAAAEFQSLSELPDLTDLETASVSTGLSRAQHMDYTINRPLPLPPPSLGLDADLLTTTFHGFSRTTTGLAYKGTLLSASFQTHWLSSSVASEASYGAMEGSVGFGVKPLDHVALYGNLGGFTTGKSVFTYEALAEYEMDNGGQPYVGGYQSALAKDVPLPKDLSNAARSAFMAGFRYRSIIETRLELRSFSSFTSSRYLYARFGLPVKDLSGVGPGAGAVIPFVSAENESFTTGSQYLYSPQNMTALRAGVEYIADFMESLSGKLSFAYGAVFEDPQANSGITFGSSASLLSLAGDFGYKISKTALASFKVGYDQTKSEQGATTYGATVFGLGFSWRWGSK